MALLAVRNPTIRKSLDQTKASILNTMMELYLSDSKIWDRFKSQIDDDKFGKIKNLSIWEAREKLLNKNWEIKSNSTEHISLEIPVLNKVTDLLSYRKWTLVDATISSYNFITSDRPVKLFWDDKELNEHPWGPGFGMKNSVLFFPLSKKFCLLARFEDQLPRYTQATEIMVASINSMQFYYSNRFLYGPEDHFYFDDADKENIASEKYFK